MNCSDTGCSRRFYGSASQTEGVITSEVEKTEKAGKTENVELKVKDLDEGEK